MSRSPPSSPPPLSPRHWPMWAAIGIAALAARIPWRWQQRAGRAFGTLLYYTWKQRRQVAEHNLERCFPECDSATRTALLRENFRQLGIGAFEFLRAWWGSIDALRPHTEIRGLEHLHAARAEGRGIILLSGHFVTLEICGRLLCDHIPLAGLYRPHAQPALEWAVRRGRLRYASAMFPRAAVRSAVRHLREGGVLWFAPDQQTRRGESVFVPFFGQPAWSLTSTHQLARLSGARVIPFAHCRRRDGSYSIELRPALADFPSSSTEHDTVRVMAAIEDLVRRCPEQYLWIHRRFKRQMGGERSIYPESKFFSAADKGK